jgi:hypothetical protein
MNYDLAKRLKDAGFPQEAQGIFSFPPAGSMDETSRMRGVAYEPSLSELIEACGTPFRLTSYSIGVWNASDKVTSDGHMGTGQSPDEAVANLWLAINPM